MAFDAGINPLNYPTGKAAGFDSRHLAARRTRFSGVASRGNFISILQGGRPGAITGTPSSRLHSIIGPCTNYATAGGTDKSTFANNLASTEGALTLAAIVVWDGSTTHKYVMANGNSGSGVALDINGASVIYVRYTGTSSTINMGLLADVPYLIIGSSDNSSVTNILTKRLDTGKIATGTTTGSVAAASNGTVAIGGSPIGTDGFTGNIAAAMISATYLSLIEMIKWSERPWDFWYPEGA